MIKLIALVLFSIFLLILPQPVFAHSGRTNSSGCHNCNVGSCAGSYHCHGGESTGGSTTTTQPAAFVAPAATTRPTAAPTSKPTPKPTVVPIPTPTPSPSPSPSPTPSPTPVPTPVPTPSPSPLPSPTPENSPEVAGVVDQVPEKPQARPLEESNEGNPVLGVAVLGATGAGAYMVFGKKKKVGENVVE